MVDIVLATTDLVREYYGGPPPFTMRGLVAVKDGRPICVAGIKWQRESEMYVMFADISDEMRKHRKVGLRMARKLLDMVQDHQQIYAEADASIGRSVEFLEHLGFKKLTERLYTWHRSPQ